jgi:hypothetical protein
VLQYIHDNQVIHRDIKPENIIRRDDGVLFLVDFGAVKLATNSAMFKTGTFIGTAEYASPEQMRGHSRPASDLYSLGVTCLTLLVDMPPLDLVDMDGNWIWEQYLKIKKISLDKDLKLILNKMTEPTISLRYQSASDVLKVLNGETEIEEVKNNIVQIPTVSEVATEVNVQTEEVFQNITPVNLKPVSIGNKYEYQDESGKVFSKVPFEEAFVFSEGFAAVKYNGKWGFIDGTGEIVIEPQFYRAYSFYNGFAEVVTEQGREYKHHFINTTGQIACSLEYDCVGSFLGAIAPVGIRTDGFRFADNKFRDIRSEGSDYSRTEENWTTNRYPKYPREPCSLSEEDDFCWNKGKYGFIYTNGDLVTDLEFDWISKFVNGYAVVRIGDQYDLINLRGQTILNGWQRVKSYKDINRKFDENLILLCVDKKYRLIKDSEIVNSYRCIHYPYYSCSEFDYIEYFHEKNFSEPYRVAKFKIDSKYGLINKKCEIILEPKYDQIAFIRMDYSYYRETKNLDIALVAVEDKVGLIDREGFILLEPIYQVSEGDATLIDLWYRCIFHPFDYRSGINDERAGSFYVIIIGKKCGLINGECNRILAKPEYDGISYFNDGLAVVRVGKKHGIINQDGERVIDPDKYDDDGYYEYISNFKNGKAKARFCSEITSTTTMDIVYSIVDFFNRFDFFNRSVISNRNPSGRINREKIDGKWFFYTEQILDLRGKVVEK